MTFRQLVPVEVYPLIGAVGAGLGLSVYAVHHHFTRDPDVSLKTTDYSWERFEDKRTMNPHFNFLEGKKANERQRKFVAEKIALGEMDPKGLSQHM